VIVVEHLTRTFGERVAVRDVSFDVRRSELVALLGPNGAGKTTTMRMMAGLIAPSSGSVHIDGVELSGATAGQLRARIGFLTESPGLWDRLTVRENLAVFAGIHAVADAEGEIRRMLERLGLGDRADTRTAELSKGMRQKVALARALLHRPDILLLDEPTSGLDPEIAREVRDLLLERKASGCAILLSTHNLDEAERLADRIALLQTTLIAIDRPSALRHRLTNGRTTVRLIGSAHDYLGTARTVSPTAAAEGHVLTAPLPNPERDTPALVRALVEAGAEIVDVRPEEPALEDIYLTLVGAPRPAPSTPHPAPNPLHPAPGTPHPAPSPLHPGAPRPPRGATGALLRKEMLDLRRNRAALLPVAISTIAFIALPLFVAVGVPRLTGEPLGADPDLIRASLAVGVHEELTINGRVQLFLFQQFLMVFLLMPITGAMTLAAHAIVGEKLARTLEPLLATPMTTVELLVAKVAGALLPTLAIAIAGLGVYLGLIAAAAEPGVMRAMLNARTFVLVFLLGPSAALVALQSAVLVSSRVNDPRSAQQIGVLIILPLTGVLVAQFTGSLWIGAAVLAFIALGLFGIWMLLTLFSVALFQREAILTRWK
jgi:ABC-2 type transport system ATP-binding protein